MNLKMLNEKILFWDVHVVRTFSVRKKCPWTKTNATHYLDTKWLKEKLILYKQVLNGNVRYAGYLLSTILSQPSLTAKSWVKFKNHFCRNGIIWDFLLERRKLFIECLFLQNMYYSLTSKNYSRKKENMLKNNFLLWRLSRVLSHLFIGNNQTQILLINL